MHTLENFFFICNSGKKQPLCRRCPSRQTPVKAFQSLFNGLHAPFEEPGFHQGSNYNTHHIVEEPISSSRISSCVPSLRISIRLIVLTVDFFVFLSEENALKSWVPTRIDAALFIISKSGSLPSPYLYFL